MERAGKLIAGLQLPAEVLSTEDLVRAAWPQAVGKRIASRTYVADLRESELTIEVEDAIWQTQLTALRAQILANLRKALGQEFVTAIRFRTRIARRPAQRAEQAQGAPADEADRIADPMLRRLYIAARKRSSA